MSLSVNISSKSQSKGLTSNLSLKGKVDQMKSCNNVSLNSPSSIRKLSSSQLEMFKFAEAEKKLTEK
jgi:hypothetical protein